VSAIAEAASVLLTRGPGSPDVLLVRRAPTLRFFGGFWAFPGGKVHATDAAVPLVWDIDSDILADGLAFRRVAAARELFEETGVLLARRPDGSPPPSGPELEVLRQELLAERVSFTEVLRRLGVTLHAADLRLIGHVTTPAFAPVRFDTTFFVAHLPPGQEPHLIPGELDHAEWLSADAMLRRWARGDCLVSPPTVMTLESVRGRAADEAPARLGPLLEHLAAGEMHPIFFAPQVRLIPLQTQALPPGTHTNAYLVGHDPAYLLDPGPVDPGEQERLIDVLDVERDRGQRLAAVVLTHQHPDHVGAAALCAERYRVPVLAHPLTAAALRGRVAVTDELHDGQRLPLGPHPGGAGTWELEAVHTPGHAAGHLAFFEASYRLLFAGDMVSTLSSVVIAPPEGDLTQYLESLRRLQGLDSRLLLPGHGNVSSRPAVTLAECVEHRHKRERQLLAALAAGPRELGELTEEMYRGLPAEVMRFARLQAEAGLRKLEREGRARPVDVGGEQRWQLI
jgi:glyoxylase-like metal-dependent hydrolase (beta-lactamase superfamily II)/8-oxo-dGTP pyrophosphatase MutT (NUDIX family)